MPKLRTNNEIISSWKSSDILCSIACTSFNHEKFIENAIHGFLIQETTFPIEIIIHDDASIDRTQDIIRKYQTQYPDIIKPILQIANQKSKGLKPSPTFVYPKCKGNYIAKCEGDDYWTDPLKLQKQVDFLESHSDYALTFHNAIVVNENGIEISKSFIHNQFKKNYSSKEMITCSTSFPTLSICFRNVLKEFPFEYSKVIPGDAFLISLLGNHGKGFYQNDIMPGVYREHTNGVWSLINDQEKCAAHIALFYWLATYYNRIGKHKFAFAYYMKIIKIVGSLIFANSSSKSSPNLITLFISFSFEKIAGRIRGLFKKNSTFRH